MKHLLIIFILSSHQISAQREIITFGPGAGEMPTVIFDGNKTEGRVKVYIGKNAKKGIVFEINVDSGSDVEPLTLRAYHSDAGCGCLEHNLDRRKRKIYLLAHSGLKYGDWITYRYKVSSKQKKGGTWCVSNEHVPFPDEKHIHLPYPDPDNPICKL